MTIKDFNIGDEVFVLRVGNAARGRKRSECIEVWNVLAVGRKYVTAKRLGGGYPVQFEESDWSGYNGGLKEHTKHNVDFVLFKDEQAIKNMFEREELERWCFNAFGRYGRTEYTLEQLRAVKKILEG